MRSLSVLIAEDDPKISDIQSRFIDKLDGFQVIGIGQTIAESQEFIDVFHPDLVLLDVFFPDGTGIELLWKIRQKYKDIDVIFVTAAKEVSTLQDAIRGGAFDYVLKPMNFNRFRATLTKFLEHRTELEQVTTLEQKDVDKFFHSTPETFHEPAHQPKGIHPLTLERIEDEMGKIDDSGIGAEDMGERIGISRTTARRYLEFLVSKGIVKPSLVYGAVGRPERLYFRTDRK